MQRVRGLAVAVAMTSVAVTACAGEAGTATATTTAATRSQAAAPAPEIPATKVGDRLRWVLDAVNRTPIAESELNEHFAAAFLQQVTAARLNEIFKSLQGMKLDKLTDVQPTALAGDVTVAGQKLVLTISVDTSGKIDGLVFRPPQTPRPTPASWNELGERLRKTAPKVTFLAAEVTKDSKCRPVYSVSPNEARPLGSMFKLYVLGAVAERIDDGDFRWNTQLTIKPELRSPSGTLYDKPDGSKVTVQEAANLMISISDNTGTDLLIHKAGRAKTEEIDREWSKNAKRNVPFLTTREMLVMKAIDYPKHAKRYLSFNTKNQKLAYLKNTVAKLPVDKVTLWPKPRDIETIEWFGSANDMCRAHAELRKLTDKNVGQAMSINDGGLALDAKQWPSVWFKGGSEPGVVDLGYSARTADGKTYFVTVMASNPTEVFDDAEIANELLSLTRGAFTLMVQS
ncbi:serine hydrolase [Rhizohabitans arisaemae]|uniref:serine hydrolase n=1 Tax=Rhizohabitans arisaemae TaxID=2720610 RepID=UPI0024B057B5|nr:serine hydrolase [Rhizohabitans arisaemae]